jgi:site-specific DNA recombinase
MKKAILMSRVSSEEQARGYSLDVQEETLKRYCENHDIEIIEIYREDHSAKNFNRPEFRKLLKYAKANAGKIDYLLFTSWDRFSRNTADAYEMIRRLNEIGIEPQAIEQPIDISIPETKAMLAIYLALPEIDNDRRSMKIKSGIRGAWKAGRWTHHAPRGYKNSRDEQNKPLLVPNEEAKHVKYIFQEISKGKSQADLRVELRTQGYEISRGGLSKLLRNPLYMGKVFVPAETGQLAYLVDGVHEPLISEKFFKKVQVIVNYKIENRKQPKVTRKREELPLRGYLICPNCGLNLTGSASRSRNKTRHFYYHCNHCGKVRVRADHVNGIFEKILGEFEFKQEAQELYLEIIKQLFENGETTRNQTIAEITNQVDQQKQRIQKLQDMLVDNKIDPEDYSKMKSRFEGVKEQLLLRLRQIKSVHSNFEKYLQSGINLLGNLEKYYHASDIEVKQQLIGSIFPEKLVFVDGKVRTARINEVLRLILLNDKDSRNMIKGQLTSNLWLSSGVEVRGVEPLTS